jgi:Leucine-rich repeat (LRR) protein
MHLSLQEYFAASFLEPRLTASRFSQKIQKVEPTNEQLRVWVNSDIWRETFVLLFELLSAKSTSETEGFLDYLFKQRLKNDTKGHERIAAALLAELVTDPFVVLSTETGRKMKQLCWRWMLNRRDKVEFWYEGENAVKSLLRDTQGNLRSAWRAASISQSELRPLTNLNLAGCSSLIDLQPLGQLRRLIQLNLEGCNAIEDLTPLANLKKLETLNIDGCSGIKTLESIANIRSLRTLVLGSSRFDLTPLARLEQLNELHLHYLDGAESDLTPLAKSANLEHICLIGGRARVEGEFVRRKEKIASPGVRQALYESEMPSQSMVVTSKRRRNNKSRRQLGNR